MNYCNSFDTEHLQMSASSFRNGFVLFNFRLLLQSVLVSSFSHAARGLSSIFLLCLISFAVQAREWKKPIELGGNYLDGSISSVYFTDLNTCWAVGGGGTILHTTDGGANWVTTNVDSFNRRLYDVHFTDQTKGWVAGTVSSSGRMYHYVEGAAGIVSQLKFHNLIAYPNPLSDKVVFEFIPDYHAEVKPQIFDAKGKLVLETVQMSTAPFANQLIFTGENHHSGLYYYCAVVDNELYSAKINLIL